MSHCPLESSLVKHPYQHSHQQSRCHPAHQQQHHHQPTAGHLLQRCSWMGYALGIWVWGVGLGLYLLLLLFLQEAGCLQYVMETAIPQSQARGDNMHFGKYCAGCSLTQQPCDVAPCFADGKAFFDKVTPCAHARHAPRPRPPAMQCAVPSGPP